jgi:predicted dithiol-disulfide oxidoreductase (DUF899 family)
LNNLPKVVSVEEWMQERDQLLIAEKEATRLLDGLAARRRRLPMVAFDTARYVFDTLEGPKTLLDLFDERPQLAVYQFMDNGPDEFCPGCTHFTNNVVDLSELANNAVSWATVSNMPLEQIEQYKARMGWTMPFVSSHGTTFARGVDRLLFVNNILDLVAYGRQEDWENSPPGWPQHPTYG